MIGTQAAARGHARLAIDTRLVGLGLVLVLAACSPSSDPPGSPAAPSASPSSATTANPSAAQPAGSGAVAVDASLLDVLPPDVDGVAIEPDPASSASVAGDPLLVGEVEAVAIGLAVDAASEGANLAIASVVRLRAGVFGDAFYRNWRDSYDEAACAQAGGVVGNAETEIGGRQVFIGSCTGGAHTYHVVAREGILVSVTAVGEKRLGEKIVAGIRS